VSQPSLDLMGDTCRDFSHAGMTGNGRILGASGAKMGIHVHCRFGSILQDWGISPPFCSRRHFWPLRDDGPDIQGWAKLRSRCELLGQSPVCTSAWPLPSTSKGPEINASFRHAWCLHSD